MEFTLGSKYLDSLIDVLPNSKMNIVFLPNNLGDLSQLMGTAMGILKSSSKE